MATQASAAPPPIMSTSTSSISQTQPMIPVGLKQLVSISTAMNSSLPLSQKPSFSLAPISDLEMMKLIQSQTAAALLQQQNVQGPPSSQPHKVQTQFLLASAQIDDKKPKEATNHVSVHSTNMQAGAIHSINSTPQQQPQQQLMSPVLTATPTSQQQLQQNANPQLKRTQPMAQIGNTVATGVVPPFNMMPSYQEQLIASMNGPPPTKRHFISAMPPTLHQPSNAAQPLAHPLATLPLLQGAINPQLAAAAAQAAAQAHAHQHLNGIAAKSGPTSSVLQLPTIPPAYMATAQGRAARASEQNGLTANGAQLIGLPDGFNLQYLQQLFFQQQQQRQQLAQSQQSQIQQAQQAQAAAVHQAQQLRLNGTSTQSTPLAPTAQNPNLMLSAYQQQFMQMMQQQQKAATLVAHNPAAQALQTQQQNQQTALVWPAAAAMQAATTNPQQLQQLFLQHQQQQAAVEQQRRRSTVGNSSQLSAAIAAVSQQQQVQQQQQQAQQQQPAVGSQLAALMAVAQRNSPMHSQLAASLNDQSQAEVPAAHINNSPTTSAHADDQTLQPPKLQRVSPTTITSTPNEDMQKFLYQINSAVNTLDPQQQQTFLQQLQQQKLAQSRLFQLQQQFAESQAVSTSLYNPVSTIGISAAGSLTASLAGSNSPLSAPATTISSMLANPQANIANMGLANLIALSANGQVPLTLSNLLPHPMASLSNSQTSLPGQVSLPNALPTLSNGQMSLPTLISTASSSQVIPALSNGQASMPTPKNASSLNDTSHEDTCKSSPLDDKSSSNPANQSVNPNGTQTKRELSSTEPCLVIDDADEHPVVD